MKTRVTSPFCLALVNLLSCLAVAQSGPPPLCKPCLFYAGDFDMNDPNSLAFDDENTLAYPDTSTYGAVQIPRNHTVLVEGLLFQIIFDGAVKLDPDEVTWEIRAGVSEGIGGNVVASGHMFGPALQPTGRFGNGPEYSVAVKVSPPVMLGAGTYWFNVTPLCLNKHDSICASPAYSSGASNTTQQANNVRGVLQPKHQIFVNSSALSYDWRNWCDFQNQQACASLSFGLIGKLLK
jgi:hypothetical protein